MKIDHNTYYQNLYPSARSDYCGSISPFIKRLFEIYMENGRQKMTARVPVNFYYVRTKKDGIVRAGFTFKDDIRPLTIEMFKKVKDRIPDDFETAYAVVDIGQRGGPYVVVDIEFA